MAFSGSPSSNLLEYTHSATVQHRRSIQPAEDLDQCANQAGPAGLVAGPDAHTVVAMKVFVKQDIVFLVRISLEFLRSGIHRAAATAIPQEDPLEAIRYFARHFKKVHPFS